MTAFLVILGLFLTLAILQWLSGWKAEQGSPPWKGPLDHLADAVETLDGYADRLQHEMAISKERHEALSGLELALHAERALFNACMRTARARVDLERQLRADPKLRAQFDRLKGTYDKVEAELDQKLAKLDGPVREPIALKHPDFELPLGMLRPEAAAQVRGRVSELKADRAKFLDELTRELRRVPELGAGFTAALDRFSARRHYMEVCRHHAASS